MKQSRKLSGNLKPEENIAKTCLYNFDLLKPHFYIVKLGFTEVYIIFSYFCSETVLISTHNICFEQKYMKMKIVNKQRLFDTPRIKHKTFF